MDKLTQYRSIIQETLLAHSQIQPVYGEIEMEVLFDQERRWRSLPEGIATWFYEPVGYRKVGCTAFWFISI